MSENKKSFGQTLKTFSPNFWVASFLQLMERWGFYGIFTLLPLYLVASTDQGGLGLSHTVLFATRLRRDSRPYRLQTLFGHFLYYNGDRLLPNG